MGLLDKSLLAVQIVAFVLCFSGISVKGEDSIEIFNVYAKKCLSFAPNNTLKLARCTYGLGVFFNWTADSKLKEAYSGNVDKCIQVNVNNSITTGNCDSQHSITWTCEGRTLKSKTGDWYLSWNVQTNEIEATKTKTGREALWVLHDTDNSVCDWPVRPTPTTGTPFIQPTPKPRKLDAVQLWPQGAYALPKASSGCPGSTNFTWQEGWIFQDLDDMNTIETKSSKSFNMAAMIDDWGNIKRWFCTKNDVTQNEEMTRSPWPNGTYCIYSAETTLSRKICPKGEGTSSFTFGDGFWDNQYYLNDSEMKGVIPGGISVPRGRTNIIFCCQDNQDPNTPMSLPIDQPFYLLAFKSSVCQKVKWATVIPEYIVYDTSDDPKNKDSFFGYTPFNARKNDPKIHYCYYQGCNHTLGYDTETEAEIKFPKSESLDMTSQSCSWRISFPPDYVISLSVISLDIPSDQSKHCNTQFLEISGIQQEGNVSNIKLCANYHQYRLRSQSNSVLIVLKLANNVTNDTGFHLNFKGIILSTESSTPMSTERSSEAAVETSHTTEKIHSENPHTTTTTSKRIQTAAAAKTKDEKISTTSIVVPVVVIVVIGVVVAIAWLVKTKRRKEADILVTFQNDCSAQENPIYEKEPETSNEGENNVTVYESIDDLKPDQHLAKNPVKFISSEEETDRNCNPLYESADQVNQSDYSSTVNSLYVSGSDC